MEKRSQARFHLLCVHVSSCSPQEKIIA
jgi:hypothetical protein